MRHLSARFTFAFTLGAMFSGLRILIPATIARDLFRQPRSQSGLPMSSAKWHCVFHASALHSPNRERGEPIDGARGGVSIPSQIHGL